jgi:hypothetical protein
LARAIRESFHAPFGSVKVVVDYPVGPDASWQAFAKLGREYHEQPDTTPEESSMLCADFVLRYFDGALVFEALAGKLKHAPAATSAPEPPPGLIPPSRGSEDTKRVLRVMHMALPGMVEVEVDTSKPQGAEARRAAVEVLKRLPKEYGSYAFHRWDGSGSWQFVSEESWARNVLDGELVMLTEPPGVGA